MATIVRDNTGQAVFFADTLGSQIRSFSFTSDNSPADALTDITLGLYDTTPSDGGTVTVTLYSVGANNTLGTALAVLGTIPDSALGTSSTSTYDLLNPASYTLTASTRYFIGLSGSSGSAARLTFTNSTSGTGISGEYYNRGTSSFSNANGTYIASLTEAPACYVRGTMILTDRGEVAVETLQPGDRVFSVLSLSFVPLLWIGRQKVRVRSQDQAPVRVVAGAFGPNQPHTDLLLSPNHSIYTNGVLVPVFCLVNGATVRRETTRLVEYYHLECPRHDVVLAQGMPAESWLDCGNRASFDNAPIPLLHAPFPDPISTDAPACCRPCILSGDELVGIRRDLHARAQELGCTLTTECDLHVVADAVRIDPAWHSSDVAVFTLPADARDLRLASRRKRPADFAPESNDHRDLGVCVGELWQDGLRLDVADMELDGWWALEHGQGRSWRWTNGRAALPSGATSLRVALQQVTAYLEDPLRSEVQPAPQVAGRAGG